MSSKNQSKKSESKTFCLGLKVSKVKVSIYQWKCIACHILLKKYFLPISEAFTYIVHQVGVKKED